MANRKLQGEIERVLKKVDEGMQVFESIWDKVYSAPTTAQKEKYEGDLKKEIKKLQRLRDQIKTWQGDSSIKDKTKLDVNRKLIEEKMEKFKVCEKETKTKAFSKEGLAQDRTDPKEKAKREVGEWITDSIFKLREQCDEFEAEVEALSASGGSKRSRKADNPRISDLRTHIERHHFHVKSLERILRAVDNDALPPEKVNELRDGVDYYTDANQEPDFYEDEEMYDQLNLDMLAAAPVGRASYASPAVPRPAEAASHLGMLGAALNFMPESAYGADEEAGGGGGGVPATANGGSGAQGGGPGLASGAIRSARNPAATPACFPSVPATAFNQAALFEKFDLDTLFFIFYYQQGTYQQYLAANELKRQSWRFHKKYLTWFQRHEEPKITTDEFEQGTYVYFDYHLKAESANGSQEYGWCQRVKSEFVFQYEYLE
ncbi:hypothetical protein I4F81_000704 [Pyropia yezoensis]|uniref:Uncharacterized protein n=1 Tax=Pyropia yezoensis TaxID=2788 RepID=A0ACC3BJF6_PYRYE|nr:hypothetical protein I4F81_000704 [Neopyropia yezoensis]